VSLANKSQPKRKEYKMYSLTIEDLLVGQQYRSSRGFNGEIVSAEKREDTKSDSAYLIRVRENLFPYYFYATVEVVA
jgi:hypothetical protein